MNYITSSEKDNINNIIITDLVYENYTKIRHDDIDHNEDTIIIISRCPEFRRRMIDQVNDSVSGKIIRTARFSLECHLPYYNYNTIIIDGKLDNCLQAVSKCMFMNKERIFINTDNGISDPELMSITPGSKGIILHALGFRHNDAERGLFNQYNGNISELL